MIVALPAKVLAPGSRSLGMGVFYTWYYVAMTLLAPLAGFLRDATGLRTVPLLFGSARLALGSAALYAFVSFGKQNKKGGP